MKICWNYRRGAANFYSSIGKKNIVIFLEMEFSSAEWKFQRTFSTKNKSRKVKISARAWKSVKRKEVSRNWNAFNSRFSENLLKTLNKKNQSACKKKELKIAKVIFINIWKFQWKLLDVRIKWNTTPGQLKWTKYSPRVKNCFSNTI